MMGEGGRWRGCCDGGKGRREVGVFWRFPAKMVNGGGDEDEEETGETCG